MNFEMSLREIQARLDAPRQAQLATLEQQGIQITALVRMAIPDLPLYFLHLSYQEHTRMTKGYDEISGTLVDEVIHLATDLRNRALGQ